MAARVVPAGAVVLVALVCATPASAARNYLETVLGTGTAGFAVSGGPGKHAMLNTPAGMALLPNGDLLVADSANNRVRRLALDGTVTTVAGNGTASSGGDGGPATVATVNGPWDVEVEPGPSGTFYIAESGGQVVRRVDGTTGLISTIAGTAGTACTPAGAACGDFGPAGSARLNAPRGIGLTAAGDLLIADTGDRKIRMVVAGGGPLSSSSPIVPVAGTGAVGTTGDGGAAVAATLNAPYDVLARPGGGFIISDSGNNRLRRVDAAGIMRAYSLVGTCAGSTSLCGDGGDISAAGMASPTQLSDDGTGGILVAETGRLRVRRVSPDGRVSTVIGSGATCTGAGLCGEWGPAEVAPIGAPRGVLAGVGGTRYYVADATHRVRVRIPYRTDIGPAGPAGTSGPDGPAGGAGAPGGGGPAGPAGASGIAGTPGAAGVRGATGDAGAEGRPGTDGRPGGRGESGDRGPVAGRVPYVVALATSRVLWPAGRRVRLRIYVGAGGSLTARALADGHAVTRLRVFVRSGLKRLDFGWLAPGRYRIVASGRDASGRASVDRATLVVR